MNDLTVMGVGSLVLAGTAVAFVRARQARARKSRDFASLAERLSLEVVGDRGHAPTAAGERGGFQLMLQRVEQHDALMPRLDVLLHARLAAVPAGAVTLQPGREAVVEGPDQVLPALRALVPALGAAARHVEGRLQLRALDSLRADAGFLELARRRWAAPWRGMALRTWLPLDASPADVESAMTGLLRARAALQAEAGALVVAEPGVPAE